MSGTSVGLDPQKGVLNFRGQLIVECSEALNAVREAGMRVIEARKALHEIDKFDSEMRQNRMKAIEMELTGDIAGATYIDENTGKEKKMFSNDTERKAELASRLDKHEEYQTLAMEIKEYRDQRVEVEFDLRIALDQYQGLMNEKDLLVAIANVN